jgi:hypothetical protein
VPPRRPRSDPPELEGVSSLHTAPAAGALYVGVRAAWRFRGRLDEAVSLPTEAVEAFGRPKRQPVGRKGNLTVVAVLVVAIGAVKVLGWKALGPEVVAALGATFITDGLVRPLATAYFAARWERRRGGGRLFRPVVRDAKNEETLYVADRPVPAA